MSRNTLAASTDEGFVVVPRADLLKAAADAIAEYEDVDELYQPIARPDYAKCIERAAAVLAKDDTFAFALQPTGNFLARVPKFQMRGFIDEKKVATKQHAFKYSKYPPGVGWFLDLAAPTATDCYHVIKDMFGLRGLHYNFWRRLLAASQALEDAQIAAEKVEEL